MSRKSLHFTTHSIDCPCGRLDLRQKPLDFAGCCGLYLQGSMPAPDAQSLMRSRYSAYVLGHLEYLLATWHPSTRPTALVLDENAQWLGLQVRNYTTLDENRAEVEFVARYRLVGKAVRLHERSRFVREAGQWLYVDGDQ